jgi:hypothetical protein
MSQEGWLIFLIMVVATVIRAVCDRLKNQDSEREKTKRQEMAMGKVQPGVEFTAKSGEELVIVFGPCPVEREPAPARTAEAESSPAPSRPLPRPERRVRRPLRSAERPEQLRLFE